MKITIKPKILLFSASLLLFSSRLPLSAGDAVGDGLSASIADLYRISDAESRSISPENFTGEKGRGGMAAEGTGKHAASELGQGWKVSPSIGIKPGATFTLAEIKGPGCINQIWMTPGGNWPLSAFTGTMKPSLRSNAPWAISSPAAWASIARSARWQSV